MIFCFFDATKTQCMNHDKMFQIVIFCVVKKEGSARMGVPFSP